MTRPDPRLHSLFRAQVAAALKEDHAWQDVTSRLLFSKNKKANAVIVAKEKGILCGIEAAVTAFKALDPRCRIVHLKDGAPLVPGRKVLTLQGRIRAILAAERVALNFIQQLSGVSTLTRHYVEQVRGTGAKILDTRKTVPGLRALQKYAVRVGGGVNHRMHLADAAMVKDNHWKLAGEPEGGMKNLKKRLGPIPLIIEAASLKQIRPALAAQADVVLLDNMTVPQIRSAVKLIRAAGNSPPQIEVSGGVSLEKVRAIARCGVDRISVGRLTHSAKALDLSLEFI